MIKVIAFDYTGVIAAFGPIKKWIENNLSEDDPKRILYKKSAYDWDIGKLTLDEMYYALSEITGTPADRMWSDFFDKQILNEDVIELINNLKKNYQVYLFSNHHGELLRKLLEKHKITDLFDNIVVSSDHKMKKPSKEFYEVLLEITGVGKNEIIFIDDSKANIEGSNNFGIKSILFTNSKDLKTHLKKEGITL